MSMSAFQKNADPFLQMLTVDDSPSSVAYLPCETTEQELTLASSCEALGPAAWAGDAVRIAGTSPSAANAVMSLRFTCPPRTVRPNRTDEGCPRADMLV